MDAAIVKDGVMTIYQNGEKLEFELMNITNEIKDGEYRFYGINHIRHGKLKNHFVITVLPKE